MLQKYIPFNASANVMFEPWNQLPVLMDKRTLLFRKSEKENGRPAYQWVMVLHGKVELMLSESSD